MEERLMVLAIFLKEFGVDISVESLSQRKTIQKAVYLGQLSGISFGYSYGWYLMGPYSPSLTQDYFQLTQETAVGQNDWEKKTFTSAVMAHFNKIKPLMTAPQNWPYEQVDWLELVASLHFLIAKSKKAYDVAVATLEKEKAKLASFAPQAKIALQQAGLL